MNTTVTNLAFAPLVPWWVILALAVPALVLVGYGIYRGARGTFWRLAVLAALHLALANPALVEEQRARQRDLAVIVVDDSPSQAIAGRKAARDAALAEVEGRLARFPDLDVTTLRVGAAGLAGGSAAGGTALVQALLDTLAEVQKKRVAGAIMITDGQVHDAPESVVRAAGLRIDAPVHVLLTGAPGEGDRRLTVVNAPVYGIVGQNVAIAFRVEDLGPGQGQGRAARVQVRRDGKIERTVTVTSGRDETLNLTLDHAGPAVFELHVEPGPHELTAINNLAAVTVNGVRDRLRVLLVSGEPHAGERVWRNLLKSDPAVDLVHFTILRPPEKQETTPIRELSLIAFPFRELFEQKLNEFDLIVFDRYSRRGVIPQLYLGNIARYVRAGGALLEAAGPGYADPLATLARTPLGEILPSDPTGVVFERGFRARSSEAGGRHPVTADIAAPGEPTWGRWFRHIDADAPRGTVLMTGAENRPLLILDRVGEGRVAQLLSDHIWLWSRGYEGGGPHSELLRRLAHWLMKEPDLEENRLKAEIRGDRLQVERRTVAPDSRPVTVRAPDGGEHTLVLEDAGGGRGVASMEIDRPGLYQASDGSRTVLTAAGPPNPLEFADARATAEKLAPLAEATGGAIHWLAAGLPDIRQVRAGRATNGRGWIGLYGSRDHVVTGVKELPLLPPWLLLVMVAATLILAWRRESV
ncbi:MAG: hypothetical protein EXQ87_03985 [Alphaproteobacteria bacterium]|nr:hypothetical protein [Alphaproteobacteria bacterium]